MVQQHVASNNTGEGPLAAFSLEGRTAVVTGAAAGIGRRVAVILAGAGATVVLADRDSLGLEETRSVIGEAIVVPTDVTIRSEVNHLADTALGATGRIDIWGNVAGILRYAPVVDLSEEELDATLAVNLKGALWGCAAAARAMTAVKRGSILNIASGGGELPAPGLAAYGMSKAAVIQLTRTVAAEVGPFGVRCNAVAPGFVETGMTQAAWRSADGKIDETVRNAVLAARKAASPLGITGELDDVAYAMLFLASDASKFVTGQVLRTNGGTYMA